MAWYNRLYNSGSIVIIVMKIRENEHDIFNHRNVISHDGIVCFLLTSSLFESVPILSRQFPWCLDSFTHCCLVTLTRGVSLSHLSKKNLLSITNIDRGGEPLFLKLGNLVLLFYEKSCSFVVVSLKLTAVLIVTDSFHDFLSQNTKQLLCLVEELLDFFYWIWNNSWIWADGRTNTPRGWCVLGNWMWKFPICFTR